MYHCPVTFYLVGLPDEIARIIEDAQPQPSFTHHFTRSDEPEEALTAQASAIFADATGHDAAAWARVFAAHRQATTTVTLIVTHDQVPAVEPYFNDIADLWIAPLSAAEASWRFNHWQRACKRYADSWETNQYLEATINSIPSLVWYKSKDGIHHKVNDAFCATVNKTKEQVQGRGHAYIWDVEADDPACIESERRVMAAKSTIVSEETVQTSDGTKNLVDMMHGTISVKSTQGKGTSFTVELTLQLACEGATAAAQEAKTQHVDPSHRLRHSRILLVDDNDLNREIAITLLEDEGFTVECAVNGCEAVEKIMDAPSGHYQLVLMDVQMPVMNGYEATKAIRRLNDPIRAQVPILAMTADAFEEDRQKALRSGMNGHLTKPVEIGKLFEALDELLS